MNARLLSKLHEEQSYLATEISTLTNNIQLIKDIINTQQTLSKVESLEQIIAINPLVDEALLITDVDFIIVMLLCRLFQGRLTMKKIITTALFCFFISNYPLAFAENKIGKSLNAKMDQAVTDLQKNKNIPKAWKLLVDVSNIIKKHPEYDDGEYAEGINNVVTEILTKPWKSISPYLTGKKGTPYFRHFLVEHLNELSSVTDLRMIKDNITKNCDLAKYATCKKIITKVDNITAQ